MDIRTINESELGTFMENFLAELKTLYGEQCVTNSYVREAVNAINDDINDLNKGYNSVQVADSFMTYVDLIRHDACNEEFLKLLDKNFTKMTPKIGQIVDEDWTYEYGFPTIRKTIATNDNKRDWEIYSVISSSYCLRLHVNRGWALLAVPAEVVCYNYAE